MSEHDVKIAFFNACNAGMMESMLARTSAAVKSILT